MDGKKRFDKESGNGRMMTEWRAKAIALAATLLLVTGMVSLGTVTKPITDVLSSIEEILVALVVYTGFISMMFHIWTWALKFER